jgi:formate/nitrite transporter FocA (FNT family)
MNSSKTPRRIAYTALFAGFCIGLYHTLSHFSTMHPSDAVMADLGALIMALAFVWLLVDNYIRQYNSK